MTQQADSFVSRRDFVKTSAAFAGASFAVPTFARTVHAGGTDTIRVGLVGCGGRGTGAATQALMADENVRLTAMADVFEDKVNWSLGQLEGNERIRQRLSVDDGGKFTGFEGYRHLVDSGVDVVLFATPPVFRPMHVAYAVEKGKHVFCEKPVAVDGPGVRRVLEASRKAKAQGTAIVSGFCWRYASHMRDTFARLHDGAAGDIRSIQTTYNTGPLGDVAREEGWSDMEWQLRNWKAFIWASGDHICEQAVHGIDWMNWAMKDAPPERCFAVGGRIARGGEWTGNMYDHFSVIYEYDNGARGYHMCRQIANCPFKNDGYITGTKGNCSIDPWNRRITISGPADWRWRGEPNDMYQQEHDDLFASIRAGKPINDGDWMAKSTLLAIMGREAAYTGQTVTWDAILNSEKTYGPKQWAWGDVPFPEVPVPGQTKLT